MENKNIIEKNVIIIKEKTTTTDDVHIFNITCGAHGAEFMCKIVNFSGDIHVENVKPEGKNKTEIWIDTPFKVSFQDNVAFVESLSE